MKAYSMDLRQRVIGACDRGERAKAVAKTFSVSPAWVRRLKQHRRERGDIVPRNGGGSRGRKIDRDRLAELVAQQPDATLVELRDRLGVSVTPWAICKVLRELKLSYKKSRSTPPSRTGPTSPMPAHFGVRISSGSIPGDSCS
jgi:transposase